MPSKKVTLSSTSKDRIWNYTIWRSSLSRALSVKLKRVSLKFARNLAKARAKLAVKKCKYMSHISVCTTTIPFFANSTSMWSKQSSISVRLSTWKRVRHSTNRVSMTDTYTWFCSANFVWVSLTQIRESVSRWISAGPSAKKSYSSQTEKLMGVKDWRNVGHFANHVYLA